MLRSVRSRVIALTIGVAVVTATATGWLATTAAERAVRSSAERSLETDTSILEALDTYAASTGSWQGVESLVGDLARRTGRRIAITDTKGLLLVDSDQVLGNTPRALPAAPVARLDAAGGSSVGFPVIAIGTAQAVPAPNEGTVVEATTCLQAAGVPYQVQVIDGANIVVPAQALDNTAFDRFAQCTVALNGVGSTTLAPADSPVGGGTVLVPGSATIGATPNEPTPGVAPAALLYLGTRSQGTLLFRGPTAWRTLSLLTAVVVAAAVGAWLLGRRLTRPLAHLTAAAQRMEAGDLGQRVAVATHDEVGTLGHAFNSMADSMQRTEALRRRMVIDIAHELRNPLVTLGGTLEAIQDGIYHPSPDVIASLADETAHLQRLVGDLHELSVADSAGVRLDRHDADPTALVDAVVESHQPVATAARVGITAQHDDSVRALIVAVDAGRVRQALTNLVANAIRHAHTAVAVTSRAVAATTDHPAQWQIEVADDGDGIPPEHVADVFERFWRADSSRARDTGGTGLGLAISRELVRAHGGDITVSSEPGPERGHGATFTIVLPLTSSAA